MVNDTHPARCRPKGGDLSVASSCSQSKSIDTMLACRAGPSISAFSGAPQHPRAPPQPAPVSPVTARKALTPGCGLTASSIDSPPHSAEDPSETPGDPSGPPCSCSPHPLCWPGQRLPPASRGPAHTGTPSPSPCNRHSNPGSASAAAGPDPTGCCEARRRAQPSLQLCCRAPVAPAPTAWGSAARAEQRRQHPCQPPRAAKRSCSRLRG